MLRLVFLVVAVVGVACAKKEPDDRAPFVAVSASAEVGPTPQPLVGRWVWSSSADYDAKFRFLASGVLLGSFSAQRGLTTALVLRDNAAYVLTRWEKTEWTETKMEERGTWRGEESRLFLHPRAQLHETREGTAFAFKRVDKPVVLEERAYQLTGLRLHPESSVDALRIEGLAPWSGAVEKVELVRR